MNKKYKDVFALADICNEYPGIRPGEITLFAPVYYPIAMVEMDVVEETYSTFDPIHEIILRMKYLGVTGISGISMATGLSEGYITKIQNVLIADGQLDENGLLTAQGSESLAKEKKIIVKKNTRTFPVDSISGRIITAGNKFLNSTLEEKKDIPPYGACIVPKDGINTNVLEESLVSGDYDTIIGRKRDVKRTNLVAIEDARFAEMKYAKCHLVKCRDNDPEVFAKIFRPSEVSSYVWKPMFVFSAEQAAAFGFDDSIPVVSHARDAVYGAYTAIDERRRDLRDRDAYEKKLMRARENGQKEPVFIDELVRRHLENSAKLKPENIDLRFEDAGGRYSANVSADSFSACYALINFAVSAAGQGEQIIADPIFQGYIVSLRTDDQELEALIDSISGMLETHNKRELSKMLKDKFKHRPLAEGTVAEMILFLEKGIAPEEPEGSDE